MTSRLYVVYDKVAKESGPIWQSKNDDVAYRQFVSQLNELKTAPPEDFELRCVGSYDSERCETQTLLFEIRVDGPVEVFAPTSVHGNQETNASVVELTDAQ